MKSHALLAILTVLSLSPAEAADVLVPGVLKHEFFSNKVRSEVEAGTAGTPTSVDYLTSFQLPADVADNYTRRVSGLFIPATTGNYVFFVCSDDDSDLFLSTDETTANKRLIAQETAWSTVLQWTTSAGASTLAQKRSDQFKPSGSATAPFAGGISLTAGSRYYIEGVHHEGGGGDNFAATFKLLAEGDPADGTDSALTGSVIGVIAPENVSIISQPTSRRVLPDQTVTLSVIADTPSAKFQWFKNGTAIAGETSAAYLTPPLTASDNGAIFHVVVSNTVNTVQSSNAVITIGKLVQVPGAKHERFDGLLRADVEAPGFSTPPDVVSSESSFETPSNQADNFTTRLSALFKPLVTGNYIFFVASDDDGDLFLSTDATPANKRQIAAETGWSAIRNWTGANGNGAGLDAAQSIAQKRSDTWVPDPLAPPASPPFANGINLVAGNTYYIEGVEHEGGGGDNLAATFKLVGEPDPQPGDAPKIAGFLLAPYVEALDGATITVASQPQNTTAIQSKTATLTIGATAGYIGDTSSASPGLSYQWQAAPAGSTSFTNIAGAGSPSYTTTVLKLSDTGTQYRVSLLAGGTNATSTVATITVTPDTTPPLPVKVTSVNAAAKVVSVTFDELLEKASAETGANYVFVPGNVAGTSAALDVSGSLVTITTTTALTPNTENTLTITGVKDLAGNAVAPNTTIKFTFAPVTYEANILADGPLAYYRFEETTGSVAKNTGSTGGDGVYTVGDETGPKEGGTPGAAKGDPGPRPADFVGFAADNRAATLDGVGDWIDTRNQFLQNRAAFTLEYWVNPVRTNSAGEVGPNRVGIVGQNDAIEYGFITPGTIQIWTPGGGSLDTAYPFPDNEWHHVATIADGTNLKNYFDGVLVGTGGSATANYGGADFNVHIGGGGVFDGSGNWFTGKIDEVAIFDKAVPADRVAAHFKAGKEGGVITTSGAVTPGGGGGGGSKFTNISVQGANVVFTWSGDGTLQSADAVIGPYADVAGATSPRTVPVGNAPKYYRFKP